MFALRLRSLLSSNFHNFQSVVLFEPLFYTSTFLSSHSLSCDAPASTPPSNPENLVFSDFLVDSFNFPKQRALQYANHLHRTKSLEKPRAALQFLKSYGFSDAQIQSSVYLNPLILVTDPEKIIKPKLMYFEELGLSGPRLGLLISKNPSLLTCSLDRKLKPSIGVIKKVLEQSEIDDTDINDALFRILTRYVWFMGKESRFLSCISLLESYGIVGSQLVKLMTFEPRIFTRTEEELETLVSRTKEYGFVTGSKKFLYGLIVCHCTSAETLNRKYELLQSFGFSKYDCDKMILNVPYLFKLSEAKLSQGIKFFLHTLMVDKSFLVASPNLLLFSMEKMVIPRLRVLEMIKARRLVAKEPSLLTLFGYSAQKFKKRFILRFVDDAEELLAAYEGHLLKSSEE